MVATKKGTSPYNLAPEFERAVGVLCATRPRFWGSVGHAVDVDALAIGAVSLVLRAVRAIAVDLGHGPSAPTTVVQRIRRWVDEGQVTKDQLDEVIDLFADAGDPPPEAEAIAELAPVIRRRMQEEAVRAAMSEFGSRGDFQSVSRIINQANRLGAYDISLGIRLGVGSFGELSRLHALDKLPLGIPELDNAMNGGVVRGTEAVVIGGTGGGKSMMLSHACASSLKRGLFTAYATLELSPELVLCRVKAALTGVPIDQLMTGDHDLARQRLEAMFPLLGTFIVKSFPARATTVPDVVEWTRSLEDAEGYPVDVLVIDYLDKLQSHNRDDRSTYDAGGTISDAFRQYVIDTNKWGLTAVGSTRRAGKERGRRIEVDDGAESQHKVKTADYVITLNPDATGDQLSYLLAKTRYGKAGEYVGPLPHDWAVGRMVHIIDPK